MPKINQDLVSMLEAFSDEGLEEEELEGLEVSLSVEKQKELVQALKNIFDERDEFSSRVDKAHSTLTQIIIELATMEEAGAEEEEEEEEGKKKVQKSPSWSFTLGERRED